ncbi:MAG: 4Fe-4S binding protein, partial [Kiritimatiellae bacterium]|nr:4Fe-4S binding protein [Kiritimatiellia bacterium]
MAGTLTGTPTGLWLILQLVSQPAQLVSNSLLGTVETWVEHLVANIKLVDQVLTGMEGSYVEMLTLLAIGLLATLPLLVPQKRRQLFRLLSQLLGVGIFIFIVYTCMGVFGMVRNFFRGLSEVGRENILAFYFCSVPVTILSTSMIFGPTFCGWMCPTGSLQEFAAAPFVRWHERQQRTEWPCSRGRLFVLVANTAIFLGGLLYLSARRVFFIEDSSIYWAEALLIVNFFLLWKMARWDQPLRRLRMFSFWLVVAAAIAGWWITSPVHLVFSKVYDPASLLSTVVVALAALAIPRGWCRYLCPWREVMAWTAKHST